MMLMTLAGLTWLALALGLQAAPLPAQLAPACARPEFTDYASKAFLSTYVAEATVADKRPQGSKRVTLRLDISPLLFYKTSGDQTLHKSLRLLLDLGRSSVAAAETTNCLSDVWDKRKQLKKGQTYLFFFNQSSGNHQAAQPARLMATFFPEVLNHSMRNRLRKLACNNTLECEVWNKKLLANVKKLTHSVYYQRVALHCNFSSHADVKVRWLKDEAELPVGQSVSIENSARQSVLTIITSAEEAAVLGKYTCEVRSVAGARRSASFTVNEQMITESLRRPATKLTLVPSVTTHFTATLTVERTNNGSANGTSITTSTVSVSQTDTPISCSSRNVTFLKCRNGQCLIALNNSPYCKCQERYTGILCDRIRRPMSSSRLRAMRAANTNSKLNPRKRLRKVLPSARRAKADREKPTFMSMFNRALQLGRTETYTTLTSTAPNCSSTLADHIITT